MGFLFFYKKLINVFLVGFKSLRCLGFLRIVLGLIDKIGNMLVYKVYMWDKLNFLMIYKRLFFHFKMFKMSEVF